MTYLIGVDLGTTATKAALFDSEGVLLGSASEESILHYPRPGWVEADPEDFYTSACSTIRAAVSRSGVNSREVKALSISGQMAGIMGIDSGWRAVTHYDSWLDMRCEKYVRYIQENYEEIVLRSSGLPTTVAHCAKILWWQNEKADVFASIKKFIQPSVYVAGRLADLGAEEAFIDYTYLHFTGLYDAETTNWSSELCSNLDIPLEILPQIVEPWKIVGTISSRASAECGLEAGTAIAAGAGDQASGFLGAGIVEPGIAVDVAGTASVLACCVDDYRPDLTFKTLLFPKAVAAGLWYPHACVGGGGLCLRWFRDNFSMPGQGLLKDFYETLDEESMEVAPGSDSLLFIPHLGGRGYPYHDKMRGVWAGFSWGHDRAHFYKSIMESIAYEYRHFLEIERSLFPEVDFKEIRVIGGGSKSEAFNRIKANVLGIPYVQLNRDEVGELGSAIIAGHAVGIFKDIKEASKSFISTKGRIEPDTETHEYYRELAELYYDLTRSLDPFYERLAKISPPK